MSFFKDFLVTGHAGLIYYWPCNEFNDRTLYGKRPLNISNNLIGNKEKVKSVKLDALPSILYVLTNAKLLLMLVEFTQSDVIVKKVISCWASEESKYFPCEYSCLDYDFCLNRVVVCTDMGSVHLLKIAPGLKYISSRCFHACKIMTVVLDRVKHLIISCSTDGLINICTLDLLTPVYISSLKQNIFQIYKLDFEPRDQWLLIGRRGIYTADINLPKVKLPVYAGDVTLIKHTKCNDSFNILTLLYRDGSIFLFNVETGQQIMEVRKVCLPEGRSIIDLLFDHVSRRLYALTNDGCLLVMFVNHESKQSKPLYRVDSKSKRSTVTAIAYFQDNLITDASGIGKQSLTILLGHMNGTISLFRSTYQPKENFFNAHRGAISCIHVNSRAATPTSIMDDMEANHVLMLLSGGRDCFFKMWLIELVDNESRLSVQLFYSKELECIPKFLSGIDIQHAVVAMRNEPSLLMFDINIGNNTDVFNSVNPVALTLHRISDSKPKRYLLGIALSIKLQLYATNTSDNFVLMWNVRNELVRQLIFDEKISSCIFSVDREDLLVSYQKSIFVISSSEYLPNEMYRTLTLQSKFHPEKSVESRFDRHQFPHGIKLLELASYKYDFKKHRLQLIDALEKVFEINSSRDNIDLSESDDNATDNSSIDDMDSTCSEPSFWRKVPENIRQALRDLKERRNREL
ncbi:hypothetical protein GJ496_002020 [Pomphorhynchus laevis]|nr:hypothetical protein GJ496_002020 [Pomphorhynchus laevis]